MNVSYGGIAAFNAVAFGPQNPKNEEYFRREMESMSQMTGVFSDAFVQKAFSIFDLYHGADAIAKGRAAMNQVSGLAAVNTYRRIDKISDFQTAGPVMQRVIMANTMIREMYHQQRIDGFSDTYVDPDPGRSGENHYEWRRIMDGMANIAETGDAMTVTFYDEVDPFEQPRLKPAERSDAVATWENAEFFLLEAARDPTKKGIDLTNPWMQSDGK